MASRPERIAVIDDTEPVRTIVARYLEHFGFTALQAADGKAGLEIILAEKPDLVLCDLRMPHLDGLELLRIVRERLPDLVQPGATLGEMMRFSVSAEATGDLIRGNVLFPLTTATTSGQSAAQNLGAVTATQYLYGALHVTAASAADTLDVVIQSDDAEGMASPTARITFTQKTAIGSQWATPVLGAITDTWWRIDYTIGGASPSFDFTVMMGIQ